MRAIRTRELCGLAAACAAAAGLTSAEAAGTAAAPGAPPEPAARRAWADGPPPGHTGGFGEPSCHRCHFDRPLDPPGAAADVRGVPDDYRPGATYRFRVRLEGTELERGGFQLSARCADGVRAGEGAGRLRPGDRGRVQVAEGTGEEYRGAKGVAYAGHTTAGTEPTAPGEAAWTVLWSAPGPAGGEGAGPTAEACGAVAVHVAANAANGDDSEFGDRIYLRSFRVSREAR